MTPLKKGASFALIAPSSCADQTSIEKGIRLLEDRGFTCLPHPQLYQDFEGYGGTVKERVQAIHWAFAQSGADAVLCVRGGYGAIQLLEHIDYSLIAACPKPFVGYSDITSLHMAFLARANLSCTIHGAMVSPDIAGKEPESTDRLLALLQGRGETLSPSLEVLCKGSAQGRLLGGNLAVFMSSLGSPFMPSLKGAVLFLEDIGEAAHRIDRMLRTLRLSGVLQECAGIVFGNFTEKEGCSEAYEAYVRSACLEAVQGLSLPVLWGMPSGHCEPNYPLPLGACVRIEDGRLHGLTLN